MNLLLIVLFSLPVALGYAVIPERIVTPPLNLFSSENLPQEEGGILVQVATYAKNGYFIRNGTSRYLSKEIFESYLSPSKAVLEMIPRISAANDPLSKERSLRRGTAFNIGNNLVLTNNHVLDPDFRNSSQCADFELVDHTHERFSCRKVHFCSKIHDVCLIEMAPTRKVHRSCLFCRGTRYEVSLADRPKLKLKANYEVSWEEQDNIVLTAIGNSAGWGIHFSQGRGIRIGKDIFHFFAPITKGNSGGPLLDPGGQVIGVVKQQSLNLISNDITETFNVAVPTAIVIGLIREALKDDHETLEKFEQAVVE